MNQQRCKALPGRAWTILLVTLVVGFGRSHAQDSLAAHAAPRPFRLLAPQGEAQQASVLSLYDTPPVARVGMAYHNERGTLRRPQDPASIVMGSFYASGIQRTSSLIVHGAFQYSVQRDAGQRWRNTAHPADEQPFIWADTSQGIWDRNQFDARVRMATAWKERRVQAGIALRYQGGVGDRRSTPKPLYRFHQLTVTPSVIYNAGGYRLAANLHFAQQSEDDEMGYYVVDSPLLYRLRGYGTFSRTPFVSGVRLLKTTQLGGGLSYSRGSLTDRYTYAEIGYKQTRGSIDEGVATTTPAGEWKKNEISGNVGLAYTKGAAQWHAFGEIMFSDLSGTDPVFQAVNYYLRLFSITPTLRYEREDRWYAQLNTEYTKRTQQDIVTVTRANVDGAAVALRFCRRFLLSDKVTLFATPGVGYQKTLTSNLQIFNPTELSDALVRPDFAMLTQSYQQSTLVTGVDLKHKDNIIRVAISGKHLRNETFERTQVDVTINYLIF